jgi:hypothetical protein
MVLGMRAPVALHPVEPGADVVEVFPRGTEPVRCATDRRAVAGPVERLELVRLLSDAVVVLPGGSTYWPTFLHYSPSRRWDWATSRVAFST